MERLGDLMFACVLILVVGVGAIAIVGGGIQSAKQQRLCESNHVWTHHWGSPEALAAHCSLAVQAGDSEFINGWTLP